MNKTAYQIRNAFPEEFQEIGQLLVTVYSQLEGFPKPDDQPKYYELLSNIGVFDQKPNSEIIVACSGQGVILGAVIFISDMHYYGSGGTATLEKNAAGFRLLGVNNSARGTGVGKQLVEECINRAKNKNLGQLIIHSTKSMQLAWEMYEKMGFNRAPELDFMQEDLAVFGFRYFL